MLLRIQPDESLRSYLERHFFLQVQNLGLNNLKKLRLRSSNWYSWEVKQIADFMGWRGCYGFNKLVHMHTSYPFRSVLTKDFSYSGSEFLFSSHCFDSFENTLSYCPLCVNEDIQLLGYSYWRRLHHHVTVCAKHNVHLISRCQFCGQPFCRDGHPPHVMWSGCAGRSLGDAKPTENKDPLALRLAQFFERICALGHHLSAETALHLLHEKLKKNIDFEVICPRLRDDTKELIQEIRSGWRLSYEVILVNGRAYELLDALAVVYESFDKFLDDCLFLEPIPVSIDSYWSTYRVRSHDFDHYVEEDYRLGVNSWTCIDIKELLRYPFQDYYRPVIYPGCNPPLPRGKGRQLKPEKARESLPAAPRLGADGWGPVTPSMPALGIDNTLGPCSLVPDHRGTRSSEAD